MSDDHKPRRPLESSLYRTDVSGQRARVDAPKAHERDTARALGGRVQKASGALSWAKGDVKDIVGGTFEFLTECKTTVGKSLRIEAEWLNKITSEAGEARYPALAIRFQKKVLEELTSKMWHKQGQRVVTAEADWVAIPRSVFQRMLEELES